MIREQMFNYQDSGSDPRREEVGEVDEDMQMAVQEVLDSKGYSVLHQMFVDTVMQAQRRLSDFQLSESQLRYEQGRLAAIADVQHRFVGLAKTKEET